MASASYEGVVSDAVKVVEAAGASIMVFGGLAVLVVNAPLDSNRYL